MAKNSETKEAKPNAEKAEKPAVKMEKGATDMTMAKMVEALVENNISLQHKVADMILNMKDLNKSVKEMVTLFTEAGEHIKKGKYEDPLLVKLDELLEQNKNIAKGLLLLEKFVKEKQTQAAAFAPRAFQKTEL
ncbi:MAG TPA: hypothetical protein HA362_05775 [Nanoarchaeota archaeon]|nr:hypothetical protein [Nanoarchaeota archaeon]